MGRVAAPLCGPRAGDRELPSRHPTLGDIFGRKNQGLSLSRREQISAEGVCLLALKTSQGRGSRQLCLGPLQMGFSSQGRASIRRTETQPDFLMHKKYSKYVKRPPLKRPGVAALRHSWIHGPEQPRWALVHSCSPFCCLLVTPVSAGPPPQ